MGKPALKSREKNKEMKQSRKACRKRMNFLILTLFLLLIHSLNINYVYLSIYQLYLFSKICSFNLLKASLPTGRNDKNLQCMRQILKESKVIKKIKRN